MTSIITFVYANVQCNYKLCGNTVHVLGTYMYGGLTNLYTSTY